MDLPSNVIIQKKGAEVVEKGTNEITAYANMASIMFGVEEVIIHFGLRNTDDLNKGVGVAKIYMTPQHAKRLAAALSNSVQNIEGIFGEIIADPMSKLTPEQLQNLQKK